jgi:hypothetical protein
MNGVCECPLYRVKLIVMSSVGVDNLIYILFVVTTFSSSFRLSFIDSERRGDGRGEYWS